MAEYKITAARVDTEFLVNVGDTPNDCQELLDFSLSDYTVRELKAITWLCLYRWQFDRIHHEMIWDPVVDLTYKIRGVLLRRHRNESLRKLPRGGLKIG